MSKAEEFKKQLAMLLPAFIVTLQFTKADGTLRTIAATLRPEFITTVESDKPKRATNPDVQAVFDIDNLGWRSFRYDSVVQILHCQIPGYSYKIKPPQPQLTKED